MCELCDYGDCPRHARGARYQLDFNPYYVDWRELEQERWDSLISTPDYAKGLDK